MASSALVQSNEDNDFGYDETDAAPITSAQAAGVASARTDRTEILPVSVADQIASAVGGLATEAANQANAAFTEQANLVLPQLAQQHQTNLGHLAAAIVTIYSGGPRSGAAFNTAFGDGLNAAGLVNRAYTAPTAPDFASIANTAIDNA